MADKSESILWLARMLWPNDVRVREVELARAVQPYARIHGLDRTADVHVTQRSPLQKLLFRWKMLRAPFKQLDDTRFQMPIAAFNDRFFASDAVRFNNRQIDKVLSRFGCQRVFSSSPFFFMPPQARNYSFHFDLVDNFFDEWDDSPTGKARTEFLTEVIKRADTVSAISHALCKRVKQLTGRIATYIPNGVDVQAIEDWPAERAQAVREKHNIGASRLFVYVGNHHSGFDGMEMLLEAFKQAHLQNDSLRLMLVGPGSENIFAPGVVSIGSVPVNEIWDYFKAADVGVLPFRPCRLTHDALPLKVLEFGAAGKQMLSTPLEELQRLNFPNLQFVPFESSEWTMAMLDASVEPVEVDLSEFTWSRQGKALARLILDKEVGDDPA
ncbi:MAG: glycosyltransferase [Planctomycetes bacterium]|nr:glycosyltransferase [Planctomycetota bacterium]